MSRVCRLGFIPPQLPSLTDQPPEGAHWIHEVKHDGYRTMLVAERGNARAYTRNGHDWSDRYPGIIAAARKLPCLNAVLDGEVIVQDAHGVSDFEALQAALRSRTAPLIFYAFDLLHLDGKDLRETPLIERRAKLPKLLGMHPASPLQFSEEFVGDAAAFFRACAAHELEGIVSKLATSRYRSGRSKTWLKTKCFAESELTLLGIAVTARPERSVHFLPSQNVATLSMQDQLSSRFAQKHARSSRLGSPNSSWTVRCFHG
jgi:DNA ligase D-like protein (predicted ligase)